MRPTSVMVKATPKITKFFFPLISSNKKMPYIDPTKPGPDVISGKEIEKPSFPLATNHAIQAMPHIAPAMAAGRILR